ncbi:hypothetical protein HDA32_005365 [Spinactinospora alkalitolerans]|uniref:Uncharacterized protein n=1 Tax=Spinactinospora alkalitolerans TaxID=687207 RepID=A0A852U428_9ACTN|nr:hypothetical protein [Spinactinospora alkalitolerans]NYE50245.1 hypothetical protein [Spinactinospora alkalitolerans]
MAEAAQTFTREQIATMTRDEYAQHRDTIMAQLEREGRAHAVSVRSRAREEGTVRPDGRAPR